VVDVVALAWQALGDPRAIASRREVSALVSTNRVYEIRLEDGQAFIAKTSSYGSYVHFRQDHQLIHQWSQALYGRHRRFLARVVLQAGKVFTFRHGDEWVAFYEKVPFYDFLPKILSPADVRSLGSEIAHFHRASLGASRAMHASWKSVGADIGALHSDAGSRSWRAERGLSDTVGAAIQTHCESFLENAEILGYHQMARIPVLVDWNPGNFSVGFDADGFKLFSRWDYDWFRVEPRILDFYFCARVVRAEGDQDHFSYLADPLFEDRFVSFLRAYHQVYPLTLQELLFLKESYRFFILTYVLRHGEHFFQASLSRRLQQEAIDVYLPRIDALDFRPLADRALAP
jgi:hypothetical protein